jgi:hypothetical protein
MWRPHGLLRGINRVGFPDKDLADGDSAAGARGKWSLGYYDWEWSGGGNLRDQVTDWDKMLKIGDQFKGG